VSQHDRVRRSTSPALNREIRETTERHIAAVRGSPERIRERLHEIDAEWDVERAIETISSGLTLTGLGLAASGRRRWLALPVVVQGFLLQHALQGWCPPIPILRRLGFRTQQEIERERYTLRALLRELVGDLHSDRPAELPATGATGAPPAARAVPVAAASVTP
jgi:hypothetical protein